MIEFDTAMIWRRRSAAPGGSPVYSDSEIAGRIVGERHRRTDEYGAEIHEELEIVAAPPALPQPGDLIRMASVDWRVTSVSPRRDLDGVLRGCSCTLVRTEAEFAAAVVWRRRTGSSGGVPVYGDTAANCRILRRLRRGDVGEYAGDSEELEVVAAAPAEPLPGDLITLDGKDYRVIRSSRIENSDGALLGCRCTAVR